MLGGPANNIVTADVNGDGRVDLVIPDQLGTVDVDLGHGDGTFGFGTFNTPLIFAAAGTPVFVAVGT